MAIKEEIRLSLRIPKLLDEFVELFQQEYEKKKFVTLSKNQALLELIRRGLQASSEMPDLDR
jgi:rRNA pseudouridine-1189 N-methylase Emg1 (Nep1/Mra1 family)